MMIYWNVIAQIKKRMFIYMLLSLALVSTFILSNFKKNENLKEEEIARINQYLMAKSEYSVEKIPAWVSLTPMSKLEDISYPQYVIQLNDSNQMEHERLIYYYPFENRAKAEECYNLLSSEEKECYDLVSCSLFYSSERNQEYIKLLGNMKQYFELTAGSYK